MFVFDIYLLGVVCVIGHARLLKVVFSPDVICHVPYSVGNVVRDCVTS